MAKKGKTEDTVETETAETSTTGGGRAIVLELPQETADSVNNGDVSMKRADYIRARADAGATRREIANELTELQGKEVPYQIVFAATKGHPAYVKDKAVAEDAPTEEVEAA